MLRNIKIGIIGSGNVAYHFATAFSRLPVINLKAIYSRNEKTGSELAKETNIEYYNNLNEFAEQVDLIIICASDDSISKIAENIKLKNQILAHTSGVVSIDVLKVATENYGSFYPLQTFTKQRQVNLNEVPFLIDASNQKTKTTLLELACVLSNYVVEVKDEDRRKLHVAAVIVNNFSNHLFALAKEYTDNLGVDFNLLKPLIQETALKALEQNPKDIQTGPAKRNDEKTIEKHLSMIDDKNLKELYRWFTKSIEHYYKEENNSTKK